MKWTRFWDMHSGGSAKIHQDGHDVEHVYIEAPIDEALVIFYNRFGHSANRVSCTCCGEDYGVDEYDTLEEATRFHRNADENEQRDASYDDILLKIIKDHWKQMPERIQKLYRVVKNKGATAGEKRNAMDMIASTDMMERLLWRAKPYISLDQFLATGELAEGRHGIVIRAADIDPHERLGSVPTQGYVWLD